MLKKLIVLLMLIQPMFAWAESHNENIVENSDKKESVMEITLSPLDAVKIAGNLVYEGKYENALQILTKMPQTGIPDVEIERWYLIAQIEQRSGNIDEAIRIYRKLLDEQPDLVKIRYELALCYMVKEQWYRADYNLRLALAGKEIPDAIKQQMLYYRYLARKNKKWNVWFNFGAAPDNNVNQASGVRECVETNWFGGCTQYPKPEYAVGYNFTLGGNYEFNLTDSWHWKNEANIYTNIYDKHKYDDLYLSFASGPRYVWENGDVWLSSMVARRWYGWDPYNWSIGEKLDTHYDVTRRLSTGLSLRVLNNKYDEYSAYLDGQSYTAAPYISFSLDSTKYFVLHGDINRDTAKDDIYANWRYGLGLGFGAEIPWGFSLYLEPAFSWVDYDGERTAVQDMTFIHVREHDFIQRYSFSISNNKIDVWGFVPTLTFSYTNKSSNIHAREYDKFTVEFSFRQRF